jgi:hypothetical protein
MSVVPSRPGPSRPAAGLLAVAALLAPTGCARAHRSGPDPGAVVAAGGPIATSPWSDAAVHVVDANGGWCWFQGERAVFAGPGRLLVGSTASATGPDGGRRGGDVDATTFDVDRGRATATERLGGSYPSDDHNAPGLVRLPDGTVVASWAGHNADRLKHSARLGPRTGRWDRNQTLVRPQRTSYSNLVRVAAENHGRGRLYDFYRGERNAHNALVSDDDGRTWRHVGPLVTNTEPYAPYVRYAVGGRRIHFIASTSNPQQSPGSSVRAGYLEDGAIHASDGTRLGRLTSGGVRWDRLTPVQDGIPAPEGRDTDVWTADLAVGPSGPVAVLTVKHPRPPAVAGRSFTQEYRYARWTGRSWRVSHLAWGGSELFADQPSYSGDAVVDPLDPGTVYLSSNVDPRTGAALVSASDGRPHWEIYEAHTTDGGATWSIAAVTRSSRVDNLRPVVAAGFGREALLWMRGTYLSFRTYDTAIVAAVRPAHRRAHRPAHGPAHHRAHRRAHGPAHRRAHGPIG